MRAQDSSADPRASKCLQEAQCRCEYSRFGTDLLLETPDDEFKFDWRLSFTVAFYMLFAFVQATLSSVEQQSAMRLSMGLGIIFCITEVQVLQDVKATILEGKPADKTIARMLGLFPTMCAFEFIQLHRATFFMAFNLLNAYSLCFVNDVMKEKMSKTAKAYRLQVQIIEALQGFFNQMSSQQDVTSKIELDSEMRKNEYIEMAKQNRKEMDARVVEKKKQHESKSFSCVGFVKKWLGRLVGYGLVAGLLYNEVWLKLIQPKLLPQ